MENLLEEVADEYSNHLLEQERFFENDLSIINFIPKEQPLVNKKIGISAWNEADNEQFSSKEIATSPKIQSQKKRIEDFLSTIKNKHGEFIRTQFGNKRKRSSLDIYDSEKPEIFLPLSNTIIAFPKSRSQTRNIEGEEKVILEKLYRKRQKSKVIPKEILINPTCGYGTITQTKFPVKNYLAKNRSFVDDKSPKKLYNPEDKSILSKLRRRFPNSYYKKSSGVFSHEDDKDINLSLEKDTKNNFNEQRNDGFPKSFQKLNSVNDELEKPTIHKMYKTIQANAKFHSILLGCEKDFSITKVKEEAKNSHLNRLKAIEKNEIHLLGSTIAKWKDEANKKLKGTE